MKRGDFRSRIDPKLERKPREKTRVDLLEKERK